ncbi:MAG: thiamine pyrophosphate-binding protein [Cyanobacteria bacterium J06621_8]
MGDIFEHSTIRNSISSESQKCFSHYQKIAADAVKERLIDQHKSGITQNMTTVSQAIVEMLEKLGVQYAFGVSGGAIAPIWQALQQSSIQVLDFQHEAGAAFAATEAYIASDQPVVVFTASASGITNALTGLSAARSEGAKVILISGYTSAARRGKYAFQEISTYTLPHSGLFTSGELFHYATILESALQLSETARQINAGLAKTEGFVSHLSIPLDIQGSLVEEPLIIPKIATSLPTARETTVAQCAKLLAESSFAIWLGFGARKASAAIRDLAERIGCAVMCSPRGKGIFPEYHPQFIGVTGFAGHESVLKYMNHQRPDYILVLGTQLGELTSFWNPQMIPARGFIHVDIDSQVPGKAYPEVYTLGVQSEIDEFITTLLKHFPQDQSPADVLNLPQPQISSIIPDNSDLVRIEVLMNQIQQIIVEKYNVPVMAEADNSFTWAINRLQFSDFGCFRGITEFSSMGHLNTGVLGTSLVRKGKAVSIVGNGVMLTNNEINTAARYQIPAVWIVLNNGQDNMSNQGMSCLGFNGMDTEIPQVDFVKIAKAMGAEGIRVAQESELPLALETAMTSQNPFIIDVLITATQSSLMGDRFNSLISQEKNY